MEAIERANELLQRYAQLALAELPAGTPVFDAHTHLGNDIDGMVGDPDELLEIQRAYGIARSFVFCLDEADRKPAFTAANDRTLAHAAAAPGELIPFVRLDLDEHPIEEATRCIDLGARGIKLHPRAQRFLPDDPGSSPCSRSRRTGPYRSSSTVAAGCRPSPTRWPACWTATPRRR